MAQMEIKAMPEEAFVQLGGGEIAYVRPVMSEEVESLFPGAPSLQPGMRLWALLNADGTPIVLTDSRAAAVANAEEHDLETVSVH
jgi:hypothetical protein